MQQTVDYIVRKMLASLLSLIAKRLNQTPTYKIDLFYCFKKVTTKIVRGDFRASSPQLLCDRHHGVGAYVKKEKS